MPSDPKKPASQTTICLLLGLCAGAGALLYLHKRRARAEQGTAGSSAAPSVRDYTPAPGDILLFHNARGMNKLITSFTASPFYHAALYAGDGNTVEARTIGVVRQDLRGRESDYVVAPAPADKGPAALAWAKTKVGDSYDYRDIGIIILDRFCRFLHFNYTPPNKFSCGEFVATAFEKAGVVLFPDRDLDDVVPGDFARYVPPQERQKAR